MMRSMFSGVSSLRVHQTRMDVIANNIANVNTDGFKAQRATFADAFYQNLQGASGPNPDFGRAGMNPRQIGLGLNLASIDNLMHQGIARRTDNALDVAIEGGGFFITQDRGGGNVFTRAGRIERDAHWNLHIGGNMLMGWSTVECSETPGGWRVDRGLLQPLSLGGQKQNMPSEPTTRINIVGNLRTTQLSTSPPINGLPGPGATTLPDGTRLAYRIVPKTIYDSLGNSYVVNMRFTYHEAFSEAADSPHSYWTVEFMMGEFDPDTGLPPVPGAVAPAGGWPQGVRAYLEGDRTRPAFIGLCFFGDAFNPAGGTSPDFFRENMATAATIAFDSNGNMVGLGAVAGSHTSGTQTFPIPQPFTQANSADWFAGQSFNVHVTPLVGVAPSATFGNSQVTSNYATGNPAPPPVDTVVIGTGEITFNFEELGQRGGENTTIRALTWDGGGPGSLTDISVGPDGTIMGRFSNGRDRILGQIPLAFFTNPAGLERIGNSFWRVSANSGPFDGVGLIGQMIGGALEGSNVDLANEFTEMITTQRGFQAASRTITVSDEMLQELVNLRR